MSPRGVLIVGAGKRVRETALPAFGRIGSRFEIRGVFARSRREEVEPLAELTAERMRGADLVYVAVGKPNVPEVLASLARFDLSSTDLLIDTPVMLPKHFFRFDRLRPFRNVWVAEDCIELPWFDVVRKAGAIREARFVRSAYAYHAFAMLKALAGSDRIASARKRGHERSVVLAGGVRGVVVEPRDYATGHFTLIGEKGPISDAAGEGLRLAAIERGGACVGFTLGDLSVALDDAESALTQGSAPSASVTARMDAMKRVGFLRLLRRIDAGRGAYPLEQGIEDMLADACLEKVGFWPGHALVRAFSRRARRP